MTRKCCRSSPRCATCPVLVAAAVRKQRQLGEPAALVAEILSGRAERPLPAGIAAALASLELARTPR
jgi:hypothetical protein